MMKLCLLQLALLALLSAATPGSTTIVLHTSARVDQSEPVTLGDIATITGDLADELGEIALDESMLRTGEVSSAAVREAIDAQIRVNWGRVSLTGRGCRLRDPVPVRSVAAAQRTAAVDRSVAAPPPDAIRWVVETNLAAALGVSRDELRLTFAEADLAMLHTPIRGATVEVRMLAHAETLPIRITMYRNGLAELDETIRVGVRVRRSVALPLRDIPRGTVLKPDMFRSEQRWLAMDSSAISPSDLAERRASKTLREARLIPAEHIEPEQLVRRGDTIRVTLVTGTTTVRVTAVARQDGKRGESIAIEIAETGTRLRGTVSDRGKVVIDRNTSARATSSRTRDRS